MIAAIVFVLWGYYNENKPVIIEIVSQKATNSWIMEDVIEELPHGYGTGG